MTNIIIYKDVFFQNYGIWLQLSGRAVDCKGCIEIKRSPVQFREARFFLFLYIVNTQNEKTYILNLKLGNNSKRKAKDLQSNKILLFQKKETYINAIILILIIRYKIIWLFKK